MSTNSRLPGPTEDLPRINPVASASSNSPESKVVSMSAHDELVGTGLVGPETIDLLIKLVGQTSRTGTFPPPLGHPGWSDQAVIDYVGSILGAPRGSGMTVSCAIQATDQQSLERLLLTSIRRFMIDEAKATPVGKLRRRLRTLLGKDERFVGANQLLAGDEAWTVPANGENVWAEDIDELNRLTASVAVAPIDRLNVSGPTPAAAKNSLLTMAHEALSRAAGAIRAQLLARFLYRRFNLDAALPTTVVRVDHHGTTLTLDPLDDVSTLARRIYEDLSADEIAILSDPEAAGRPSQAHPARDALFDRLRVYSGNEVGRDAVNLTVRWCVSGTALVS